jgi:Flp pilus assembly protein TadD
MQRLLSLVALGCLGCAASLAHKQEEGAFNARKQLTRELVARGDWANAFAYADELHRQRPGDGEVLTLRGIVYRERNLPAEAESDLRAALQASERDAEAHAALGILLDAAGKGREAEVHHRRAVQLAPSSAAYLNNLGFSLLVRHGAQEAMAVLQRAASLDPTNRRVRTNLGFALAALGDLPRAAREFEMGGAPAEAKNNLGFAYERRGDLGNAFDLYVAALRIDATCARARSNLTQVARQLGRPLPADLPDTNPAQGAARSTAKEMP